MSKEVVVEGKKYKNRSEAARHYIAKGGKTCTEIAKLIGGITAQTVYTQTPEGKANVEARHKKYHVIRLAKSGKYTRQMICDKVKVEQAFLNAAIKDLNIEIPNQKELHDKQKAKEDAKAQKVQAKKVEQEQKKATKKAAKQTKAKAKAEPTADVAPAPQAAVQESVETPVTESVNEGTPAAN